MISFLGANGFNTYIYAPKSDPYIRSTWRKTHPQGRQERLDELIRAAAKSGVDFIFTVSPGLDIAYSSLADQRLLVSRVRSATVRGCGWVGIFLDDIEPRLVNASDRRRFRSLGEAHVSLLNGLFDELAKDGTRLMLCPTYYANDYLGKKASENEYLEEIRAGLAGGVDVMWTGKKVISARITKKDVSEFFRAIGRKPFLWDNYPVNDYYGDRARLNVGPFEGRAPEILPLLAGYVSNPMNESEASKIPLLTLRDYLRNPYMYSPEKSLARAARKMFAGRSPYDDVTLLVDCTRAGPLNRKEAEDLRLLTRELMKPTENPQPEKWKALSRELESRLTAIVGLRERMLARGRKRKMLTELEPVVNKTREIAELGVASLKLMEAREEGYARSERQFRIDATKKMKGVKANRVQALGEVVFNTSGDDIGLTPVRIESPLIELYRWSLKTSKWLPARSRKAQFR